MRAGAQSESDATRCHFPSAPALFLALNIPPIPPPKVFVFYPFGILKRPNFIYFGDEKPLLSDKNKNLGFDISQTLVNIQKLFLF
jgi:hypothetical protein